MMTNHFKSEWPVHALCAALVVLCSLEFGMTGGIAAVAFWVRSLTRRS